MNTLQTQEDIVARKLLPADRCDRCSASAYILAVKNSLDLQFCMHHGKENELQLIAQGFIVYDQTAPLFSTPALSQVEA